MISDPFDLLAEIAQKRPPSRWMLVGGLMVHCHAQLCGVQHQRPTHDADLVVEIQGSSYVDSALALSELGYEVKESPNIFAHVHRFVRGDSDVVDLMVPDRQRSRQRFKGREVVSVPGASSALKRTIAFRLEGGEEIRIPDLASAISLKSAAYFMPGANRERHLQDVVTLLACLGRTEILPPPSKSMKKNIVKIIPSLSAPQAWSVCMPEDRGRAIFAARRLNPEWATPEFLVPKRPGRR